MLHCLQTLPLRHGEGRNQSKSNVLTRTNMNHITNPEVMVSVIHTFIVTNILRMHIFTPPPPVKVLNYINRQHIRFAPNIKDLRKTNTHFTKVVWSSTCPVSQPKTGLGSLDIAPYFKCCKSFSNTGCARADFRINVRIGSTVIHTLVDTGAAVSVININTYT